MLLYPNILPLLDVYKLNCKSLGVAEQYDKRGSTSGVIGNLILLSSPAAKTSFVFKFSYAGREGLYFFTGTGLQIITKPYGIDNYMELIYQDSAIYIHETGSVPMSYAYKKL